MAAPACSRYSDALSRMKTLLATEKAAGNLRRYLSSYGGARFDRITDRLVLDEFTPADFTAVRELRVSVLYPARQWLLGEGRDRVKQLLHDIPADLDIWDVRAESFDSELGSDSPAWRLWQIISDLQDGAGFAGRYVTASKLLHGKRPRLIPIYDRGGIGKALDVSHRDIWEVMWCALRDAEIRQSLVELQADVDGAADLSLLRVLDIVLWMSINS
jgi:Family of unknown function (DUF6308)